MLRALTTRARRRLRDEDAGMTLVELMVYSVILLVVLLIVGSLLVNGLRAHATVRDRSQASDAVQNAFGAVERAVRNAGGGYVKDSGRLLVVRERVASSASDADRWRCVGFYLDETSGDLRRVVDATGSQTSAALAASVPSTVAGAWPVLVADATAITGRRAFGPADGPLDENKTVDLALRALAGRQKPVELVSSVALRPQSGSALTCW